MDVSKTASEVVGLTVDELKESTGNAMKAATEAIGVMHYERSDEGDGMQLESAIALMATTLAAQIDGLRTEVDALRKNDVDDAYDAMENDEAGRG